MSAKILVVDDEPAIIHALRTLLAREGYEVVCTDNASEAMDLLENETFNLLLCDVNLGGIDGAEVLKVGLKFNPKLAVVMITAYASVESAVNTMRIGAFDYVTKPFRFDDLLGTVRHALLYEQSLHEGTEGEAIPKLRYYYRQLVGDSLQIRHVYEVIDSLAQSTQPILFIGESGTGKTLAAWVVHCRSGRYHRPYAQVNCKNPLNKLRKMLIEVNMFEQSYGGSALFENIHALEPEAQQLLLKFLQTRTHIVNGEGKRVPRDTRLLATSDRDLQEMVQEGKFLAELYYQLAAVPVDLPPLRRRMQDLPLLTQHFLDQFGQKEGKHVRISPVAMSALELYQWPGNLRELRDVLALAARACKTGMISPSCLPPVLRSLVPEAEDAKSMSQGVHRGDALRKFLRSKQSEFVSQILQSTAGDRSEAAKIMGIGIEEFNRLCDEENS